MAVMSRCSCGSPVSAGVFSQCARMQQHAVASQQSAKRTTSLRNQPPAQRGTFACQRPLVARVTDLRRAARRFTSAVPHLARPIEPGNAMPQRSQKAPGRSRPPRAQAGQAAAHDGADVHKGRLAFCHQARSEHEYGAEELHCHGLQREQAAEVHSVEVCPACQPTESRRDRHEDPAGATSCWAHRISASPEPAAWGAKKTTAALAAAPYTAARPTKAKNGAASPPDTERNSHLTAQGLPRPTEDAQQGAT